MNAKAGLISIVICFIIFGFISKPDIKNCCLSYNGSNTLVATPTETVEAKPKTYKTSKGSSDVIVTEAYKIVYTNSKKAAFVILNVEQTSSKTYNRDTNAVMDNMKYQVAHGKHIQNQQMIDMNFNDSRVHGFSHTDLEKDSILGKYAIFPGNGIILHITLLNVKPEFRTYQTLADYRNQCTAFLGGITSHLRRCKTKQ